MSLSKHFDKLLPIIALYFCSLTLFGQNEEINTSSDINRKDPFAAFHHDEPNDKVPENKASILVIGADPSSINLLSSTLVLKIKRVRGEKLGRTIKREITKTGLYVWNGQKLWSYNRESKIFDTSDLAMSELSSLIEKIDPEVQGNFEVAIADDSSRIGLSPEDLLELLLKLNMLVTPGSIEIGFYIDGKGSCSQLVSLLGINGLQSLLNNMKLRFLKGRETSHVHIQDGDGRLKIATMALSHRKELVRIIVSKNHLVENSANINNFSTITDEEINASNEIDGNSILFDEHDTSYANEDDYEYLTAETKEHQAIGGHLKVFLDHGKFGERWLRIDQRIPSFSNFNLNLKLLTKGKTRPEIIQPLMKDSNFDSLSFRSRINSRSFFDGLPNATLEIISPDHNMTHSISFNDLTQNANFAYLYEVINFDETENKNLLRKINERIVTELLRARMLQLTSYQKIDPAYKPANLELNHPNSLDIARYIKINKQIQNELLELSPGDTKKLSETSSQSLTQNKNNCADSFSASYRETLKVGLNPPKSLKEHLHQVENMQELFRKKSEKRISNLPSILANYFKK